MALFNKKTTRKSSSYGGGYNPMNTMWDSVWSWRKKKSADSIIESSTDVSKLEKISAGIKERNANNKGFEALDDYMIQDMYDMFYDREHRVKLKDDLSNWWWYKILSKFNNYQLKPITNSSSIFSYMVTNHMSAYLAKMLEEIDPEELKNELQKSAPQPGQGQGQGEPGEGEGDGEGEEGESDGQGSGNGQGKAGGNNGQPDGHDKPDNNGQQQQSQGKDNSGSGQEATGTNSSAGKGTGGGKEQNVNSTPQKGNSTGQQEQQTPKTQTEKKIEQIAEQAMNSLQDFLDKNKENIEEFEAYQKDASGTGEGASEQDVDFGELERLKKLNSEIGLNKEHIDAFVKQSIKSFSGYFDKQSKGQYESILDADVINELSEMELLMIDDTFIDLLENKFYTSKKKFDVYIDISGSMSSGVNINPEFNSFTRKANLSAKTQNGTYKNIPSISLAKILAYKLLRSNMLNDFYIFDDYVEQRDKAKILDIGLRGGTSINRVVQHIQKTGLPSVIITDACDSCPDYSPLAYMINVAYNSSSYLEAKDKGQQGYQDCYAGYYMMDKKNQISMFIDNHFLGPGKVKDYSAGKY